MDKDAEWLRRVNMGIDAYIKANDTNLTAICRGAKLGPTFIRDLRERGRDPSIGNLRKLCAYIGLEMSYVFGGEPLSSEDVAAGITNASIRNMAKEIGDILPEERARLIQSFRAQIAVAMRHPLGKTGRQPKAQKTHRKTLKLV